MDNTGTIKLDCLKEELDDKVILVTLMAVNNETGMIQPILAAYDLVKDYNKVLMEQTYYFILMQFRHLAR